MTKTCTISFATTGACGKPAVYVEGEFAECAEHAAQHGSLFNTQHMIGKKASHEVGDEVAIKRHGKTYTGIVSRVGARGAVYATVTYLNGATREVRV